MEVRKVKVGYLQTNCYIVVHNNQCIIVDPGDDPALIERQVATNTVLGVLITHHHSDHVGSLNYICKKYGVPYYDSNNLVEKRYSMGDFKFEVIKNPGHAKDAVSFYFYEYNFMFVGDFIFKNTIGRTDLEGGDMEEMNRSLQKISTYPKTIRLYPGHGEETTLKDELQNNYYLKKYSEM